jgi:hypothetical protein
MRRRVIEMLRPIGAFAVENSACDGTPDVCTVAGWIELKIASWPARESSRVVVDVRLAQGLWLKRWARHGGRAWTLLRIDEWWFLHDARWSCDHLGNVTQDELRARAVRTWEGIPDARELIHALIGG